MKIAKKNDHHVSEGIINGSVNAAQNSKSSNVRNRPGPESFSQQSTLAMALVEQHGAPL
jgi:hypothetical protein